MQQSQNLPKIGVIVANFNYGHWILDAIKSAIEQDYPNKEIYVIDDCSTDNTKEIVDKALGVGPVTNTEDYILTKYDKYPVYFLSLKKNGGPSRARNFGIKLALENSCQIISILDADDMMVKNKLSKCVLPIIKDPEVIGFVYADYYHMYEDGMIAYESKEPYSRLRLLTDDIVHSGFVVSALAMQKIGVYYDEDLRVCEDYNYVARLSNFFVGCHIAEPLTIVRVQSNNSTNTVNQERWQRDYYYAKQRGFGM